MIVSEDQAKTMWCPFARVVVFNTGSGAVTSANRANGGKGVEEESRCIGSACMAWRWKTSSSPASDKLVAASQGGGYCGLAGPAAIGPAAPAPAKRPTPPVKPASAAKARRRVVA